MKRHLIKAAVRFRFLLTPRARACAQIRGSLHQYLLVCEAASDEAGRRPVRVPNMLGVDEDMRDWSLFMILEHNAIVNRRTTEIVERLAHGRARESAEVVDPKRDVMPSANPGSEQTAAFRESVERHLKTVAGLSNLRGTITTLHPIFGQLDAHGWHCMFGFHLDIHLRQARVVTRMIT